LGGIAGWIVFGFVLGAAAKFAMPETDAGGIIVRVILGVIGAVVGGALGRALGLYRQEQPIGLLGAAGGAVVVLALYRIASGGRRIAGGRR